MRQLQDIYQEQKAMGTILELTGILEGIAGLRISQIKNHVQQSQQFFDELWQIYTQIRVDGQFRFGRSQIGGKIIDKELFIVITAEGGFSGDIDQKLIDWMLTKYDAGKNDIIVIGHHGVVQLAQKGIGFKRYFKLPKTDINLNLTPLIEEVKLYRSTKVFFQTYVSLMVQDVKSIVLGQAVQDKGRVVSKGSEIISEETYIFEPSAFNVVDHLEQSMMGITLGQVILESKLAQYASRFRAMTLSHHRAHDSMHDIKSLYAHARRSMKDERLKEIINGLRKASTV